MFPYIEDGYDPTSDTMGLFRKKENETDECMVEESKSSKKEMDKVDRVDDASSGDDSPKTVKKLTYVVSTHPDGGWQVKRAGSTKVIRRFDTKKEADEYAKKVASNNGGSILRKKKDGKIQKKG